MMSPISTRGVDLRDSERGHQFTPRNRGRRRTVYAAAGRRPSRARQAVHPASTSSIFAKGVDPEAKAGGSGAARFRWVREKMDRHDWHGAQWGTSRGRRGFERFASRQVFARELRRDCPRGRRRGGVWTMDRTELSYVGSDIAAAAAAPIGVCRDHGAMPPLETRSVKGGNRMGVASTNARPL
jgi:hypothetical protein